VGETLGSLIDQGQGLERVASVWVVDDCSSDDTLSLANAMWSAAVPLKVLKAEQNRGQWVNTNDAVARIQAFAEWILVLHSDDVAKRNWLDLMLERISQCDASVATICSSWDEWRPDGSVVQGEDDVLRPVETIRGNRVSVRDTLVRGCWWHISGSAIRLKAFDDIGGFDTTMPQLGDWEWLLRCLARGWSVEYVPRTLIRYRQHEASVSARSFRTDRDIRESLEIIRRHPAVLSSWDVLRLHGERIRSCLHRMARAVLRRDVPRALLVLQTSWIVVRSLVRLVVVERRPAGGRERTTRV
jgi:glycosyltransferase involved in cell wall biosynthesis